MNKLRILYVDFNIPYLLRDIDYPIGGASVELFSWIEGFKKNKIDIGVLTWKGAKKFIGKETPFDLIESYDLKKGVPKLRLFYHQLPNLYHAIKKYGPLFLIQENASMQTGLMACLAKILNIFFIYRVASDADVDNRIRKRLTIYETMAYETGLKFSDFISCQNEYQYTKLVHKFPTKNLFILHNPFIINNQNENVSKKDKSYIAWIGNFRYSKNLPALLEIVKQLPEIEFRIAGKLSNNLDPGTINAIDNLQRYKNVKFVGYLKRSEIPAFLNHAYLLLNTSHYEGFSNTFLESWATGTPVVSTKNVNPDDLINKYKLGVIADSYSDIPALITTLLNLPDYDNFSMRCKHYVAKYHDPQQIAKNFVNQIYSN